MCLSGTGHQTGCRPAGTLMKVGRCADILQGDLGEFRPPSAPDSSVQVSVLILTGSSHVNERLIVAASDSPFVRKKRKRIQRCCLSIKYSRSLIKIFCKFGASMAALLLGKEAGGFNELTGSLPQPAGLFLGCRRENALKQIDGAEVRLSRLLTILP